MIRDETEMEEIPLLLSVFFAFSIRAELGSLIGRLGEGDLEGHVYLRSPVRRAFPTAYESGVGWRASVTLC